MTFDNPENQFEPLDKEAYEKAMSESESVFTLDKLQQEQKVWAERNFPDAVSFHPLLGAVEEIGELSHAHLKDIQGIRKSEERSKDAKADAVADVIIYLAHYCTLEGINMSETVEEVWNKVKQRNWKDNPVDADKKVEEKNGTEKI